MWLKYVANIDYNREPKQNIIQINFWTDANRPETEISLIFVKHSRTIFSLPSGHVRTGERLRHMKNDSALVHILLLLCLIMSVKTW